MTKAVLWTFVLLAAAAGMFAVRSHLGQGHVALLFLLIVLGGSASGGRSVGLWLSAASFLCFDLLFLPPYGTLVVANPLDWLVLVTYLVTSVVAAQLLYNAQEHARVAEERAAEVNRLATLGAETLNAPRAEDALTAIAAVIREATGVSYCEIYIQRRPGERPELGARTERPALATRDASRHPEPGEGSAIGPEPGSRPSTMDSRDSGDVIDYVVRSGTAVLAQSDGTTRLGGPRPDTVATEALESGSVLALVLPLQVQTRTVGVLRLASEDGLRLDPERQRFLDAISYYAALGVERVRLSAEAEHAEALREADRLKDALIASVSHDLRTPLTTIKALAHDLVETGDERTEIIEQEADRLNRMVADLLDLSRLSAGALPMRIELNAVDDLIGALVQQVEPALGGRRLEVSLPPGAPLLLGRFDLVHSLRILANLVGNAAKHAPGDTPIEIVVADEEGTIAISVADRGPGVPAAEVDRIFEPFYRPAGGPPDVGGAGLGLSIARQLAEAQGGKVTYHPRQGGGSVFTLRLPASEPPVALSTRPTRVPMADGRT